MAASSQDVPHVVVFPPLLPLGTVAASVLMQVSLPLELFTHLPTYVRLPMGAAVLVIGIALTASGGRALRNLGTNIAPSLPTIVLVRNGIFRWTRNPMYLGGCLAMCGIALLFALDWFPLIFALSLVVLHFGIIKREERYLEQKFGDKYHLYASRVPRYFRFFLRSPSGREAE
jgi:protein-S-isoprenylcysteine O-methyltransferase Ste14